MTIQILRAREKDQQAICEIQRELKRPFRANLNPCEYFIAWQSDTPVGCAATSFYAQGAYFYGLAVRREWQRQGIGSQLMDARLEALRVVHGEYAIALAMFWNSRFFRRHGFSPIKRNSLPPSALHHPDLTNPAYARSAVMFRTIASIEVPF